MPPRTPERRPVGVDLLHGRIGVVDTHAECRPGVRHLVVAGLHGAGANIDPSLIVVPLEVDGVVEAVHDVSGPVVAQKTPMVLGAVDRVHQQVDVPDRRGEIALGERIGIVQVEVIRTGDRQCRTTGEGGDSKICNQFFHVGKRLKVHVESERDHLGLRIGAAVIDAVSGLGRRREFGVEAREIGEGEQVAGRYVDTDAVDLRLARPPLREGVAQRDILEFEIRAVLDEMVGITLVIVVRVLDRSVAVGRVGRDDARPRSQPLLRK